MTLYVQQVGQNILLNQFNAAEAAQVVTKEVFEARKKAQEAEAQKRIFELARVNMELAMYDYILYDFIQAYVKDAMDEAKKLKIWEQIVSKKICKKKGIAYIPHHKNFNGDVMALLNEAETLSSRLEIACKISERTELLDTVINTYNYYRNDYSEEGISLGAALSYSFKQHAEGDLINHHAVIRRNFVGADFINQDVVNFVVKIYKAYTFCCISEAIAEFEREKISIKTACRVKFQQSQSSQFSKLKQVLKRICDVYIPSIPEDRWQSLNESGQYILNHLLHDDFAKKMISVLLATIKDYTHYCVARWLLEVRSTKSLSEEITKPLIHAGFEHQYISNLVMELKKSRIGIKEKDVWELKDLVPRMSSPTVKEFINVMYDVIEDELN